MTIRYCVCGKDKFFVYTYDDGELSIECVDCCQVYQNFGEVKQ